MPLKKTVKKAQKLKREGKSTSTQAGAFVEEEMDRIREGKTGAKNARQAVAIGLSKARQAGVKIPSKKGEAATGSGRISKKKVSAKRSRAAETRMKKEGHAAASHKALSMQAHRAALKRTKAQRHESAVKAARTREENKKAA
jgi:hypothetical protein